MIIKITRPSKVHELLLLFKKDIIIAALRNARTKDTKYFPNYDQILEDVINNFFKFEVVAIINSDENTLRFCKETKSKGITLFFDSIITEDCTSIDKLIQFRHNYIKDVFDASDNTMFYINILDCVTDCNYNSEHNTIADPKHSVIADIYEQLKTIKEKLNII